MLPRKIKNTKTESKSSKVVDKKEVKQIVQSMLRGVQELKIHIVQSSASVDYNGTIVHLSAVPQGDADIARDGDRIYAALLSFRWYATVADTSNLLRVILFQWIPDNASISPTVANVLQTVGTTNSPISYKSIDFVKDIKIMYDWTVKVDTYHLVKLPKPVMIKRFHDKQIQFTGALTCTNGLYALFISDSAAVTHPTVNYYSTLRFTDS